MCKFTQYRQLGTPQLVQLSLHGSPQEFDTPVSLTDSLMAVGIANGELCS